MTNTDRPYQRRGGTSNSHVGSAFELAARHVLAAEGIRVEPKFGVLVGVASIKKTHVFDLGSALPKVLVECKSHRWTEGGNAPSAKLTVWNEAMYYFHLVEPEYRKILFVLKHATERRHETVATYYIRRYGHLIPAGVEIWEYDEDLGLVEVIYGERGERA